MRPQPRSRFKRNDPTPERRITGRVVAHPLTGQPEPWVEVEEFECDASEFRSEMRNTVNALSTQRAGDVLAFRVRPQVNGTSSFYWYLSPIRGPMPVPAGDPNVFLSKTKPGKDWLSLWAEAKHPLTLFVGLASVERAWASNLLWRAYDSMVEAIARHPAVVAAPRRNKAALAALARRATLPRPPAQGRGPARVIELLGENTRAAREAEGLMPLDQWRAHVARPILSALHAARAMLATNRIDETTDWNDPGIREARAQAAADLNAWVRERVSLDVLASALNAVPR